MKSYKVVKRGGFEELFDPKKLCGSIQMVGAGEDLANQVCGIVASSIESNVSTEEIFVSTRNYLREYNPRIAALYGLERGLSALGPSGFLFEQYIAALFQEMNYKVKTNVYMQGEGVEHEIDVVAEKGNVIFIIEAKYRNDFKTKTHINQVMYADARLGDIQRKAKKDGSKNEYYMWLITNTQFTDSAINYVKHRNVQLMGWNFPPYINLMKIVHEKKLYPVTVLPSITKSVLKKMASLDIVLVKALTRYSLNDFQDNLGCSMALSKKLHAEVAELIK